ncbi:hydantoinase B/oxoprolinase family protein [Microbacterium sp. KR10-403]|uniref:hydantoinase B/oxoprolinase family protein n=1 Tax=Microbacterium sp. KR10-403 TaxID=3158581 RepID=UPI0032E5051D
MSTTPVTDPITAEVVRNGLVAAANEMNNIIVRTAFNPLLFDTKDFGIAVLSADGELWAEDSGLTSFVGCMPATIQTGLRKHGAAHFRPGDVLIVNDPYLTGTHISDTTVYMPVHHEDALVAFVAVTAHWADVGGRTPGGWDMTSTELYQEGMCFTHQRLIAEDAPVDDLLDFISANVRFPEIVRGDLDAQIAACRAGAARVRALCERFGPGAVNSSMDRAIQSTASTVSERIAALPDGVHERSIVMDYDGIDQAARPVVAVQVAVDGDRIKVTFDGTSPTSQGSMNLTGIGTRSEVHAALKGLLAPLEPSNAGHFKNVDIELPQESLVNPTRPAGSDSFGFVAGALTEMIVNALAELFPETSRAGSYQLFGVHLIRTDPRHGEPFIMIDPLDGGHGAHSAGDGATAIFPGDGDTLNLPVEVLENRYPLRCLQYAYVDGSRGHGEHNGGYGLVRDYQVLEDGTILKYANENTKNVLSIGVAGGDDGEASRIILRPGESDEVVLTDRGNDAGELRAGDIVRTVSGGGGGWGGAAQA